MAGCTPHRRALGPIVRLSAIGDMASDRKGLDILVEAMKLMPELRCALRIVGGGSMLSALRQRAAGDERIRFLGPLHPQMSIESSTRQTSFSFLRVRKSSA